MLIDTNGFHGLSIEEQREYVLNSVHRLVEIIAKEEGVSYQKLSTQNILRNLKFKKNLKLFNHDLLLSLIYSIGIMQNSQVELIKSDNRDYHHFPLYCYGKYGNLTNITVYDRVDDLEICISLLNQLESKRILPDKETKRRLLLNY